MNLCTDNAEEWRALCRVEAAKVQAEALRLTPRPRGPGNDLVDKLRHEAQRDQWSDVEKLEFRIWALERELREMKRRNGK